MISRSVRYCRRRRQQSAHHREAPCPSGRHWHFADAQRAGRGQLRQPRLSRCKWFKGGGKLSLREPNRSRGHLDRVGQSWREGPTMLAGTWRHALLAAAGVFAVALSACGGGGSAGPVHMPPTSDDDTLAFTTQDIDSALGGLLRDGNAHALVWHAAGYPSPDAVTCLALIIACEGGRTRAHPPRISARYEGFGLQVPRAATNPDVPRGAAATWSGVMSGLLLSNPDRGDPDAFVSGDATITVSGQTGNSGLFVDVEFSNIRNEATGAGIAASRRVPGRSDPSLTRGRWPSHVPRTGGLDGPRVFPDRNTACRCPARTASISAIVPPEVV